MCNFLLERLKGDHTRFKYLFAELERLCVARKSTPSDDAPILKAILDYLGGGALLFHHALEDAIYARLLQIYPQFPEIYDLADDHKKSWREFDQLTEDLAATSASFVGNETAHFIAEEEIFFPYAAKFLQNDDWGRIERSVAAAELLAADADDPIIVRLLQEGGALKQSPSHS